MSVKALYAGSFDPITNGHLDIIKRASKICDELVIGVICNPQKTPLMTINQRKDLIKRVTGDLNNVRVESFQGLLADYVNNNTFDVVVRGLRTGSDFENEISMAQMNARLYKKNVETIFLMTCPEYAFISSSMVKEVASLGGNIEGLVPNQVYEEVLSLYHQ